MDSSIVIMNLETICREEYISSSSLSNLYRDVMNIYTFIHDNISNELFISLHTELQCVHNEIRLGDGDYDEMVFDDCIEVLKQVLIELKKK